MSFDLKHLPKTFQDLVIADPLNASIIQRYCTEIPSKPLLLAGPPGAGKTEAAFHCANILQNQKYPEHDLGIQWGQFRERPTVANYGRCQFPAFWKPG